MNSTPPCLVSINGRVIPAEQAQVSVFDRGFLFGDSVYEATLVKNKTPLFWKEHFKRMQQSAQIIDLQVQPSLAVINQWIQKLLDQFQQPMGLLRLVITRGAGAVNIAPPSYYENNVVIFLQPLHYPSEWYTKGLHYYVSSYQRNSPLALDPRAKTGNYLNSQLALNEAKKQNYHDALMINAQGFITEGTTNNFWFIKKDTIYTADVKQGILEGITRDKIFELCQKNNIKVREGSWRLEEVLSADEAFMSSATKGIVPIVKLSQWSIGAGVPGTKTLELRNKYEKMVDDYIQAKDWNK